MRARVGDMSAVVMGPRGWLVMGRYGQWDGAVRARVLRQGTGWLGFGGLRELDAGSAVKGAEGVAELMRLTGNHVEIVDSYDRGR